MAEYEVEYHNLNGRVHELLWRLNLNLNCAIQLLLLVHM